MTVHQTDATACVGNCYQAEAQKDWQLARQSYHQTSSILAPTRLHGDSLALTTSPEGFRHRVVMRRTKLLFLHSTYLVHSFWCRWLNMVLICN